MNLLLRNGLIFDGERISDEASDMLIESGIIVKIAPHIENACNAREMDISGKLLCPGFVDVHSHLRDPGQEWREDIASGAMAGLAGGYTTLVAMPNTDPCIDSAALVRYVTDKGKSVSGSRVLSSGCVSKGRKGAEMAEMGFMAEAGAVLFTDDGNPVATAGLLRNALLYSKDLGIRIMEHPEEKSLTIKGQVNDGLCSSMSGLKGIPASSELICVERGLTLVEETGVPMHFTHVSTRKTIDSIRKAKKDGLHVTCDVTPHHLVLSEESVIDSEFSSVYKVNPPLRSRDDVEALWDAIDDGTVDAVATDHAPWHLDEKDLPFEEASFGIASLECSAALVLDAWNKRGRKIPLPVILRLFTTGSASLLPVWFGEYVRMKPGCPGDVTVLDLDLVKNVEHAKWRSKAGLTPYDGMKLRGWPVLAFVAEKGALYCMECLE